ncbi:MAG: sulfite exporter TauE/SafE family protein [Candidatus Omnitrophota bacterium]|jgi:uncharacterized membrane protein YfcA|nr:MAG: sulfite exporter TauE/SafE family protein [Candidatus Omnitrophota bacterium]
MVFYAVAGLAVIITGIAKAGFGGGVGIVATPLMILVVPSTEALGIMLPILCVCDWFSIYHYRTTFDAANLYRMLPGAVLGITVAGFFLGFISKNQEDNLQFWIGVISIAFVGYQLGKAWILKELKDYHPKNWHGWLFGVTAGITSTMAHAAGPVATMFLLPQNLGRRLFVGTTVWFFTVVNAVKLIPYFYHGMINLERISTSLVLLPLVPIGTFLGVWMNKNLNEQVFNAVIYTILFLIGLKLISGVDPIRFTYHLFT